MKRRVFLKKVGLSAGMLSIGFIPFPSFAKNKSHEKLTILHTNDVHSRIDPFPKGSGRNTGLGGAEPRAALIRYIRSQEKNVLLLDSGDMWQGTPYFNMYHGEVEFKVMSAMNYDASTLGNHDFDVGIKGLKKQLPHANFDILCANYDFSNTALRDTFAPYKIYKKGNITVGVFGVGIELQGLVPQKYYEDTKYIDPVQVAQKYATLLKYDKKCDLVICLSHLGYNYQNGKICDTQLAESTTDIDIILGGHTHTFMDKPDLRMNPDGKQVCIHQVGFAGIILGRIDVDFEISSRSHNLTSSQKWIRSTK